jgi:hypothetical protein
LRLIKKCTCFFFWEDARTHARTLARTHTNTCTRARAHTYTKTGHTAHTHTLILTLSYNVGCVLLHILVTNFCYIFLLLYLITHDENTLILTFVRSQEQRFTYFATYFATFFFIFCYMFCYLFLFHVCASIDTCLHMTRTNSCSPSAPFGKASPPRSVMCKKSTFLNFFFNSCLSSALFGLASAPRAR